MVIVETLSHVFRPLSLAIRLFGNMFADHLVLGIFTDLTKLLVPVAFYVLARSSASFKLSSSPC